MTEKLKQIIKDESLKLPKELREVIDSFDWVKISEEIGKLNLLDETEINDLQIEVSLALVGLEEHDSLALNIENNVGTSKIEAVKISNEVNQKIFDPMFEKMEEITKNKVHTYDPSWEQTINFIISGGDYSAFIEKKNEPSIISPSNTNIKSNFNV